MSDLETSKGVFDWFLKKDGRSMVIIMLFLIVGYLGWEYNKNNQKRILEVENLKNKVEECLDKDSEISDLKIQIEEFKYKFILIEANSKNSPNPQWLTDATTGNVLWINPAYEKKYLKPIGKTSKDLLGTNGDDVFGEVKASQFVNNNNWVIVNKRPRTFQEVEETLKYPVFIGDYVFAVGGMEYEKFN